MEFFQKIQIWPSINERTNAVVEEELSCVCFVNTNDVKSILSIYKEVRREL